MFTKEKILYWVVLGFACGIVAGELVDSWNLILGFIAVTFCVIVFLAILDKKTTAIGVCVVLVSLCFGFGRNEWVTVQTNHQTVLDELVNEKIAFVGTVIEEQERREFNTRLQVRVNDIESSGKTDGSFQKIEEKIKVLVTTTNPRDFRYGDIVRVRGDLVLPENFYTETGREFNYVGYLKANKIKFLVKNAGIESLERDPPSKILSALFFAKREFVSALARRLPEPQSSLAAGILIDGKQSINGELQEKFRKTGLVHIVVLSGYNVSIVAEAITKVFMFLPRLAGMFSAVLGIIAFAPITGASATVIRASIMAIVVILSRLSLRNYDPTRGLFIASFLMLVHNPSILLNSPSFQLSFLATFAVTEIVPRFERLGKWVPERFGLRELVVSNIVVQAFLFPVLSWMTGFVSAVSLPVNLLVLPFIPFTMLMCFMTGLIASVPLSPFLFFSMPFAFVSNAALSYELAIVNFFSEFSFAEIPFGWFSSGFVIGFYVLVIVWVVLKKNV